MVLGLANEMAERGVDVSVLTARQTQVPLIAPSSRVKVKQFPTFHYYEFLTIAPMYAANLIRERYDAVIVFFADFGEGWALRLASPFTQPSVFLYLTFPYESAPHRYQSFLRWKMGERAAELLADAKYTATRGEDFFHLPILVLPSGTDPIRFRPDEARRAAMRKKIGYSTDDVVLINVAALETEKGAWRVIEALPVIRAQCPNVRYLVIGEGEARSCLEASVQRFQLQDAVTFIGTTSDLAPYYNAADIFVMLADAEAGSIACLEAMASGLPVIVSDTGGFGEVVDASNGYRVGLQEPNAFIQAVVELAHDEPRRRSLGQNGRFLILEKFSLGKIAESLVSAIKAHIA